MPKVSIIIPTYNRTDLLPRAIQSVINQTYKDWELLIIDDGSTDNTKEIVEEFVKKDPRIRYFYKENGGQGSARNLGIKNAKGEYIAFLDSDDEWLPEKLDKQIHALSTTEEKCGFCFCDVIIQINKKSFNEDKKICYSGQSIFFIDTICARFVILPSTLMIKSIVVKKIGGFDETEFARYVEDVIFGIKLAHEYEGIYLSEKLVVYRTDYKKIAYEELSNFNRIKRYVNVMERYTILYKNELLLHKKLADQYRLLGSGFMKTGEFQKGLSYLIKSIFLKPSMKTFLYILLALPGSRFYKFIYLQKRKIEIEKFKN